MTKEIIKEILGNKIDQCTHENFIKGYDPICDLIDELEGLQFDTIVDYNEYYGTMDYEAEYYENILCEIASEMKNVKEWRIDFNEKSIDLFKRWFFMRFNYIEYLPADIHLNFYWSSELIKILMDLSLIHLDDYYGMCRIGGSKLYFQSIDSFLTDIARVPLDQGFINISEAINKENEELVEQLLCDLENRCADCTSIPEIIEAEEFKSEERYEGNKCVEEE